MQLGQTIVDYVQDKPKALHRVLVFQQLLQGFPITACVHAVQQVSFEASYQQHATSALAFQQAHPQSVPCLDFDAILKMIELCFENPGYPETIAWLDFTDPTTSNTVPRVVRLKATLLSYLTSRAHTLATAYEV